MRSFDYHLDRYILIVASVAKLADRHRVFSFGGALCHLALPVLLGSIYISTCLVQTDLKKNTGIKSPKL